MATVVKWITGRGLNKSGEVVQSSVNERIFNGNNQSGKSSRLGR